jgi:hypothetical protein
MRNLKFVTDPSSSSTYYGGGGGGGGVGQQQHEETDPRKRIKVSLKIRLVSSSSAASSS